MSATLLRDRPVHEWIRGISIRQPWATCISMGAKRLENRPRHWSWTGWILLHASGRIDRAALHDPLVARTLRGHAWPTGVVLGVAWLAGCHQDAPGARPCDPWAHPGAHHLELTDIQPLPSPIPATGALGPWKPLPGLVEQVLHQLPQLRP